MLSSFAGLELIPVLCESESESESMGPASNQFFTPTIHAYGASLEVIVWQLRLPRVVRGQVYGYFAVQGDQFEYIQKRCLVLKEISMLIR